jgi:hypothetical protein
MKVKIEIDISDERLKDVLCGAFEGGSNYWYEIKKYIKPTEGADKVEFKHIEYPFLPGGGMMITDTFSDHDAVLFDRVAIAKGLNIMAEKYPSRITEILEESDDAETSDVLLQCCLFGEIVYG